MQLAQMYQNKAVYYAQLVQMHHNKAIYYADRTDALQ